MNGSVYTYNLSDTLNGKLDNSKLSNEISNSEITVALNSIDTNDDIIYVIFKNALSSDEQNILTTIINNHDGVSDNIPDKVIITENKSDVSGYYQIRGINAMVKAHTTHEEIITWPFNIRILSITLAKTQDNDLVEATLSENTPVGVLLAHANIGDNYVIVSDTAIENFKVGFRLSIGSEKFLVTKIVQTENKIYLDNTLQNAYDEYEPILLTILFTYNPIITSSEFDIACGFSALGGSLIAANSPLKIKYTNQNSTDINTRFYTEIWY